MTRSKAWDFKMIKACNNYDFCDRFWADDCGYERGSWRESLDEASWTEIRKRGAATTTAFCGEAYGTMTRADLGRSKEGNDIFFQLKNKSSSLPDVAERVEQSAK